MFGFLALSWFVVYLSIFRGLKNSSWVRTSYNPRSHFTSFFHQNIYSIQIQIVYVTATLPFAFLFILLGRGLMLPGSVEGILYYLKPNWTRLLSFDVSFTIILAMFSANTLVIWSFEGVGRGRRANLLFLRPGHSGLGSLGKFQHVRSQIIPRRHRLHDDQQLHEHSSWIRGIRILGPHGAHQRRRH